MRLFKKRHSIFKKFSDVETVPTPKKKETVTPVKSSKVEGYDSIDIKDLFDDNNTDIYYEEIK